MSAIGPGESQQFNPHFQLGLDVQGRRCLIIGGGSEAGDKARRLLDAHAKVVVVAAEVDAELDELAARGRLVIHRRRYRRRDLRGCRLVVNTMRDDAALCARVYRQCVRRNLLINTYDLPRLSTVAMAALVSCGHLRISISTSNASPTLAARLRADLQAILDAAVDQQAAERPAGEAAAGATAAATAASGDPQPVPATGAVTGGQPAPTTPELAQFLDQLGALRMAVKDAIADRSERVRLLREALAGLQLSGTLALPAGWRERLRAAHDAVPQARGQPNAVEPHHQAAGEPPSRPPSRRL